MTTVNVDETITTVEMAEPPGTVVIDEIIASVAVTDDTQIVVVEEIRTEVLEVQAPPQTATVTETVISVVSVAEQGPQGIRGPEGPEGPPGPSGATGSFFSYEQLVAAIVWEFDHPLSKKPSVTTVDSLEREIKGTVEYLSLSRVRITFIVANAGFAYLN